MVVISGNQLKDKNITDVTSIKFTLRSYNLNGINPDYYNQSVEYIP